MTEPEYIYVKGQGWVLSTGFIVYDKGGQALRVHNRTPNPGEIYFRGYGIPISQEALAAHARQFYAREWGKWREGRSYQERDYYYLTLEPL